MLVEREHRKTERFAIHEARRLAQETRLPEK
jgi:hypothetical protein